MAQTRKIGKTATGILDLDGYTCVLYHNTLVVQFNEDRIILDNGGWETVTTKTRMNQASNEFDLGYYVYAKKGIWYIDYKETTYVFQNGMMLYR